MYPPHFLWINALIIKLKLKIEKKPESRRDDKIELKIIKENRFMKFFQAITLLMILLKSKVSKSCPEPS